MGIKHSANQKTASEGTGSPFEFCNSTSKSITIKTGIYINPVDTLIFNKITEECL
jgi:hypothetical protein